jgi:hypothetical protein
MTEYLGEMFTDCNGYKWEIWPNRGLLEWGGKFWRVSKKQGRWYFTDSRGGTEPIEDAPRYPRSVVTEIERRWPDGEQKTLFGVETAVSLMGDEDLVRALKESQRSVRLWSSAAVISSVLAAIHGLLVIFL